MLFYKYADTIEIVSGEWSGNTLYISGGELKHVFVKATASSTVFDFKITDSDDNVVLNRINEIGKLNEMMELPMLGIHTLSIINSTADEDFNIKLMIKE